MIENDFPQEGEPEVPDESPENLALTEETSDERPEVPPPPDKEASRPTELPDPEEKDGEPSEAPPIPTDEIEEVTQDEAMVIEEAEEPKKKPGLLRRVFRWLMVILIFISIGAILALYLLYIPLRNDLWAARQRIDNISTQSEADLQNAQDEIERLTNFESQNQVLSEQNDQILLNITLLEIRTDILTAQTDVLKGNNEKALIVLSNTPEALTRLASLLPVEHTDFIESLQKRLELAQDGIERGDATAETDLNVLIMKMLELEDAILR